MNGPPVRLVGVYPVVVCHGTNRQAKKVFCDYCVARQIGQQLPAAVIQYIVALNRSGAVLS